MWTSSPAAPAVQRRRLLTAAVALTLFMAGALARVETDDAYTVLRYARNLVDHGELTYNLGERISALTSPLHALLVAALYRLTGSLVLANKALGLACALAAALALALPLRGRSAALPVALALFTASPFVLFWTFGGLETPLLAALFTALAALAAADLRRSSDQRDRLARRDHLARAALPFALGGLAMATRFDASTFVAPILLGLAVRQRRAPHPWRRGLLALLAAAAPPLAWLAFADRYYGHLLPTSFYVKTPRLDPLWLLSNAAHMAELALVSGLAFVYGAAFVFVVARPPARAAWRAHFREHAWLYAGLAGAAAYGLVAATTHLFYAFRLFVPILGPAALLAADLVARLSAADADAPAPADRIFSSLAVALLALQLLNFIQILPPGGNLEGARSGEMRLAGVADAIRWVHRFARPADAIRRHWQAQPASARRPPRIHTFAVGALAFALPEARVHEMHVNYRHHCRPSPGEIAAASDYVTVLSPAPEEPELGLERMQLLFEEEGLLAGSPRRYRVYFNPDPAPPILPPRIDAPCLVTPRGAPPTPLPRAPTAPAP